jgi:hypothetical protein
MAPGSQEATFLSEDEHEEGESSMARVADKVPLAGQTKSVLSFTFTERQSFTNWIAEEAWLDSGKEPKVLGLSWTKPQEISKIELVFLRI